MKPKEGIISEYPDHRLIKTEPKGNMRKIINKIKELYLMIVLLNSSAEISIKGVSEFEKNSGVGKVSLS